MWERKVSCLNFSRDGGNIFWIQCSRSSSLTSGVSLTTHSLQMCIHADLIRVCMFRNWIVSSSCAHVILGQLLYIPVQFFLFGVKMEVTRILCCSCRLAIYWKKKSIDSHYTYFVPMYFTSAVDKHIVRGMRQNRESEKPAITGNWT